MGPVSCRVPCRKLGFYTVSPQPSRPYTGRSTWLGEWRIHGELEAAVQGATRRLSKCRSCMADTWYQSETRCADRLLKYKLSDACAAPDIPYLTVLYGRIWVV